MLPVFETKDTWKDDDNDGHADGGWRGKFSSSVSVIFASRMYTKLYIHVKMEGTIQTPWSQFQNFSPDIANIPFFR